MANTEAFRAFDLNDEILSKQYPSVAKRYYKQMYRKGIKLEGEDMCILVHTNRVCCVVTLAPSHPLLQDGRKVTNVDFQITEDTNRLENKVTGKSKKGGQWLHDTSRLCNVTCNDGSVFTLYSGVSGRLVEVNERLVEHPELLTEKAGTEGFLAIVLVRLQDYEKTMASFLTREEYELMILDRRNGTETTEAGNETTDTIMCTVKSGYAGTDLNS